jgi:hypothetical protein
MMIHDITKVVGKHRPRKRVGRGEGSGITTRFTSTVRYERRNHDRIRR